MTVQDVDEALLDTVCARLREQLGGDEASKAETFARQYYRWVSPDDIAERSELDVYGAALAHFDLARRRTPGTTKVRIYNPRFEAHGWRSQHTAVEIVTDDMPFLIDSVAMELNRRGFGVHLIIHPVIRVCRDGDGRLLDVVAHGAEAEGAVAESVIHAEVARQTDPAELSQLERHLLRVIGEVRAAVEDWPEMRARALDVVSQLEAEPPPLDPDEVGEARAFMSWLEDHNFTFLGARDYTLARDDDGELRLASVPDSGLGVLRQAGGEASARGFEKLPPAVRARALEPYLLNLTKANTRATVHRPAYLDYVGIKRFDDERRVVGERRFLGLYTHTAYHARPSEIPILRRKVEAVLRRAAFPADSHNEKALLEILESYPRDELFQISTDDLFRIAMGILHLGERQRMRLFARRDTFDRFLSCLVFVPRDRFNTENRRRIERILRRATSATSIDYTTRVSESVLVRLHYLVYAEPGKLPRLDEREIETLLVAATRSWVDDLEEALFEEHGEELGGTLLRRYRDAFPPAYRADWVPRSALADIGQIEALEPPDDLTLRLYRPLESPLGALRAKVFRAGAPLALSAMLPLFEDMGVEVADERPYEITPRDGESVWVYDFGLTYRGEEELQTDLFREAFQDSFIRVWSGDAESDGYNRLVLRAGLTWHETTVMRAIGRYLRQAGTTFSDRYVEQAIGTNAAVARLLMDLFRARFEPGRADPAAAERLVQEIEQAIDAVESLDQDRILRNFLDVVQAMLQTNFFQTGPDGERKPSLAFKLDPARLPWLPPPRPRFEIFVYSPRTEGVHLRGGPVARGGIRWSDRREDFRTEVLGLMKAQMVKNAVIVPVGAKGGFVVKRPPAGGDREELLAEVERCYRTYISGLLDLTDEHDPYLVVAADKGTAALSDVANEVSAEYGFWLGDAFASGGSTGYDHKKMGITARGAWESVKRHFRELGHDVQSEDFTVVGIGDMSGDVFGNGMLLSRHIRLVAAFDHRHVFIDPDPDAAASWEERRRLFELPRSSWDDYDRELISAGGGVWPRSAKKVALTAQARAALGVEHEALAPNDLIRVLLRAPVDLLWNGGIGTYVKASTETHAEAGDKASDGVRVDAGELRCRVIGEGGNLGLTQRARIEYAARGRQDQHRRDRQLGRGGLLRPRGEHQDPARRRRGRRRPDRQAAQPAARRDDAVGGGPGPEEQLRAVGDAQPGRGAGVRDGRRARPLPRRARGLAQARPRAGGASRWRGAGRAKARARGADPSGAGGGARLQQDRPVRRAARLRRARGPAPVGRARPLLPRAAAGALRRADALPPAAARDHRHTGGQQHAARRRDHLRLPAARGERRARVRDSARVRRRARHLPDAPAVGRDRGARQPGGGERPDRDAARGPAADRARLALAAAQPPPAARHRRDRALLRARRGRALRRRPAPARPVRPRAVDRARRLARAGGRAARARPARGHARDDVRHLRHRGGGGASRASTSSRWPPCTSGWASDSSCTGCVTGSWPCHATTAGARWRGRRCATICTGSTGRSPRPSCARRRPTGPRTSVSTRGWRPTPPRSAACRRWPRSASGACSTPPRCRWRCARCATCWARPRRSKHRRGAAPPR